MTGGLAVVALAIGVLIGLRLRTGVPQAAVPALDPNLALAIVKLSHDLRGALSPALLMAERLEGHADPKVKQAGETIAASMDRAAALAREASALAKVTPPAG
jgi:signal transduction histidine kinase